MAPTSPLLPHGYCFLWQPGLLSLHVIADALVGLSYVAISSALWVFVRRSRPLVPFSWMFVMFGTFIIACGATHFMEIWTLWHPDYWLSGGVKVVTAVASVRTALLLPPLIPTASRMLRDAHLSEARRIELQTARAVAEARDRLAEQAHQLEQQRAALEDGNRQLRLANDELEQANAAAQAASQAKSTFMAAMSHELRTPLNAIGGYVELLTLEVFGPLTVQQREALTRVQRSQQHLLLHINDVLNFAKLEAGRVDYSITDVRLSAAVADALAIVEAQLTAANLTCEVDVPPELVARADGDKLGQILLNLLSNAIKFTGRGGRLTIDARHDSDSQDNVALRITDSGIGIAQDKLGVIFDPFVQVHRKLTEPTEGTGLGLAISRDLARGMGGDLTVDSTVGRGSTFTIVLATAHMSRASRNTGGEGEARAAVTR
jgi:signal transduction histidine kinase